MAQFIYIDETGSVGSAGSQQPYLTLAAVLVHEDKVRPLAEAMDEVAFKQLGWVRANFEFHGHEIWGGTGAWSGKTPPELLAAFEAVIALLDVLDLSVVYATINKAALHDQYGGAADANAYRLALQFLLEKVDVLKVDSVNLKVVTLELIHNSLVFWLPDRSAARRRSLTARPGRQAGRNMGAISPTTKSWMKWCVQPQRQARGPCASWLALPWIGMLPRNWHSGAAIGFVIVAAAIWNH